MTDEAYIRLTLELAKRGFGRVSPNPLVGALIVKDHKIIGAGFHEFFGGPHAEQNAFARAEEDVTGATLYVNLEPCVHFGKTPPCVDSIISRGISRVVIGSVDPNPLVAGKGVQKLRDAGVAVVTGIEEAACADLNRFFFKFIEYRAPYITLKIAQTLDGKIADQKRKSKWITSETSRKYVHLLRSRYDAVLIGIGTVLADNPKLDVRMIEGRNPAKVIIDSSLRIPVTASIITSRKSEQLIIATSFESKENKRKIRSLENAGVHILYAKANKDGTLRIADVLRQLGSLRIASLLVEGGSKIFTSFMKAGLFDEVKVFIAPLLLGEGIPAFGTMGISNLEKARRLHLLRSELLGTDVCLTLRKN